MYCLFDVANASNASSASHISNIKISLNHYLFHLPLIFFYLPSLNQNQCSIKGLSGNTKIIFNESKRDEN